MKEFLKRLLGVDALKAQIDMLQDKQQTIQRDNEAMQLEISMLSRGGKQLDVAKTQASQLMMIVNKSCFKKGGFVPIVQEQCNMYKNTKAPAMEEIYANTILVQKR